MTKGKKILAVAVSLTLIAGGVTGGVVFYRKSQADKHRVEVISVSNLMQQNWADELYMDGIVAESNSQSIVLSSDQLVEKVLVNEGDAVTVGTPLLEYDMTAVALDVAQKKTSLALAEDNVRQAKKELDRLKSLRPSEEAPSVPDYPFEPDFPEDPDIPSNILSEVTDINQAADGNGMPGDPYQFACKGTTIVRKSLLEQLITTNTSAVFVVYDETGYAPYAWLVSSGSLSGINPEDWILGERITLTEDGGVQISGGGVWYGIIQVGGSFDYDPAGSGEEEPSNNDEPTEAPTEIPSDVPDETETDTETQTDIFIQPVSFIVPLASNNDSENYMYSRSELQYKISQQETEIRSMEIAVKKAQIEYDSALEKQHNPEETAKIDGVVTKLAASVEELEIGEPYLVVQGEGDVLIEGSVSETNLDKITVGSILNVNSWETGEVVSARVTEIFTTPTSYNYQNYGQNPNNSLYPFRAVVEESSGLTVGNYVSITFSNEAENGNFYIPLSYVRQADGQYYVMKESEEGRLQKQIIQTGKIISGGYLIEIISGLSESDKICFPYGKYVTEGALVKENSNTIY
ncbi:MAG: hypothetical protein ACI4JD_01860 [Ruminococcus sp.]